MTESNQSQPLNHRLGIGTLRMLLVKTCLYTLNLPTWNSELTARRGAKDAKVRFKLISRKYTDNAVAKK